MSRAQGTIKEGTAGGLKGSIPRSNRWGPPRARPSAGSTCSTPSSAHLQRDTVRKKPVDSPEAPGILSHLVHPGSSQSTAPTATGDLLQRQGKAAIQCITNNFSMLQNHQPACTLPWAFLRCPSTLPFHVKVCSPCAHTQVMNLQLTVKLAPRGTPTTR